MSVKEEMILEPVGVPGESRRFLVRWKKYNAGVHLLDMDSLEDGSSGRLHLYPDGFYPARGAKELRQVALVWKDRRPGTEATVCLDDRTQVSARFAEREAEPRQPHGILRLCLIRERQVEEIDRDHLELVLYWNQGELAGATAGPTSHFRWRAPRSYFLDTVVSAATTSPRDLRITVPAAAFHPGENGPSSLLLRLQLIIGRSMSLAVGTISPPEEDGPLFSCAGPGEWKDGLPLKEEKEVLWRHNLSTAPFHTEIPDHVPPRPGEHPRLVFREEELPRIRERAGTPVGRRIVQRLRYLLGHDGKKLPERINTTPPHNRNSSPEAEPGTFTSFHAAGYGLLYQLTGERRYADLARGAVEWMFKGVTDIDNRYTFAAPGAPMRAGSLLAGLAYAYDLAYDGWDPAFRETVARELLHYHRPTADGKCVVTTKLLSGRSGNPPGSNHYGSLIGGPGIAALAVLDDPGVDSDVARERLAEVESNIPRMLELGFGDAGMYAEGHPPSRLSANGGFLELLRVLRTTAGRDYLNGPRPNGRFLTARWIHHLGGRGFANFPSRGTYGGDGMQDRRGMLSNTGDFAVGFGAVPPEWQAALLWTWETFVKEGETECWSESSEPVYNVCKYPHRAIYALADWPLEKPPANPAEVLPLTSVDRVHGYFITRNRWRDAEDVIVTHHLDSGPRGYYPIDEKGLAEHRPGTLRIWGHGVRTFLHTGTGRSEPVHYASFPDGSFSLTTLSARGRTGLFVDLSGEAAACLVLVAGPDASGEDDKNGENLEIPECGPWHRDVRDLSWNRTTVRVFALHRGEFPEIKVGADGMQVGNRAYRWRDGRWLRE